MNHELFSSESAAPVPGISFMTAHRWIVPAQRLLTNPNLNFKEGESPDSA